ncbi:Uncharacterised protein [Vibrio cholerae]|nr:Uncharacterised protein [Vibrio cholerae]CSB55216.1 Uncharacterised protein [Vibrio cholerae]CSC77171.1 Uncharacterised protein [Vibrio cholerae]CSI56768.1 Uncharacterised protein [Vibrio cholerae]
MVYLPGVCATPQGTDEYQQIFQRPHSLVTDGELLDDQLCTSDECRQTQVQRYRKQPNVVLYALL